MLNLNMKEKLKSLHSWHVLVLLLIVACVVLLLTWSQKPSLQPVTWYEGRSEQDDIFLTEKQVNDYKRFVHEMATEVDFAFENCEPLNFSSRTIDQMTDLPHKRDETVVGCIPQSPDVEYCSPLFIGIGAQKSGTTSLFSWIESHPQFTSKSYKELHYFDKIMLPNFVPSKTEYLQDFPRFTKRSHRFTGEITPSYMDTPPTAFYVNKFFPDIKIIVCLRDPTERAYSQYNYHRGDSDRENAEEYVRTFHEEAEEEIETIMNLFNKKKNKPQSFEDLRNLVFKRIGRTRSKWGEKAEKKSAAFLYPVLKSMFYYQLHDWVALFPPENILIILLDEMQQDPVLVMRRVEEFLGLVPFNDWESVVKQQFGSDNSLKSTTPKMLPETKLLLKRFYDPMVVCLERMTGKNLTHWRGHDLSFLKLESSQSAQKQKTTHSPIPINIHHDDSELETPKVDEIPPI